MEPVIYPNVSSTDDHGRENKIMDHVLHITHSNSSVTIVSEEA